MSLIRSGSPRAAARRISCTAVRVPLAPPPMIAISSRRSSGRVRPSMGSSISYLIDRINRLDQGGAVGWPHTAGPACAVKSRSLRGPYPAAARDTRGSFSGNCARFVAFASANGGVAARSDLGGPFSLRRGLIPAAVGGEHACRRNPSGDLGHDPTLIGGPVVVTNAANRHIAPNHPLLTPAPAAAVGDISRRTCS